MRRAATLVALALSSRLASAQSQLGAEALGPLVQSLSASATRVLIIGAHPDDEDTPLIAWLARGRGVETAYLSLSRGEGGQNIIGSELGDALGILRTEELLAARRIDGAQQYFTAAFDFGYTKTADETFTRWPRVEMLRQTVAIVRSFRPHVIVSVWSGTPRDGHGHHQAAGMLAREAYDAAGDSIKVPRDAAHGLPLWTPLKFYRGPFIFNADSTTVRFNVGEYAAVLGKSYAELAAESRSQHKSQAFGSLPRRGVRWSGLQLEHSRVGTAVNGSAAQRERSLFDGIDTTWSRFSPLLRGEPAVLLASLGSQFAAVQAELDLVAPYRSIPALGNLVRTLDRLRDTALNMFASRRDVPMSESQLDLVAALETARERASRAMQFAAGIAIEATVPREVFATTERVPVSVAIYNRGRDTVRILERRWDFGGLRAMPAGIPSALPIAPDSVSTDSVSLAIPYVTVPWWMAGGRNAGMYESRGVPGPEASRDVAATLVHTFELDSARIRVRTPVVYRYADQVKGEVNRGLAMAPAVTVRVARTIEYVRANTYIDRTVLVTVSSSLGAPQTVKVTLQPPGGLSADSAVRQVQLAGAGSTETIPFRVRGRLTIGRHEMNAVAAVGDQEYRSGYILVDYDHIRPRRMYVAPRTLLQSVDVRVPQNVSVAYVPGVADHGAAALEQLGIPVTTIEPSQLRTADLRRYTTLVVGPRAYDASPALRASRDVVLAFARRGGTVVVQYGQYEMMQQGMMPYPINLTRPADRVTDETAPVRFAIPTASVLRTPNVITERDFEGWVQERGLYMPRTFDARYAASLELNDTGEAPNRGALLVAPVGRGLYIYTTLSLFRQLPSGVPGAARLLVNLVSARAAPAAAR